MALISCPECEKEISDKADACPHCGFPLSDGSATPVSAITPESRQRIRLAGMISRVLQVLGGILLLASIPNLYGARFLPGSNLIPPLPSIVAAGFFVFGTTLCIMGTIGVYWFRE